MSNENLKLWDACKSIDEKNIKQGSKATQGRQSVDGLEMVRVFTEAFGPIGDKWDYEIVDDKLIETVPMKGFESADGKPLFELSHNLRLRLNINHGGEWRSFEQYGHTKVRYVAGRGGSNPYITFDEEYAKKSATDALKKCLSLLGVAADVYTGALDDHNYKAEVADKLAVKAADESVTKRIEEEGDIERRLNDAIKCIEIASDEQQARRTIREHLMRIHKRTESRTLGKLAHHALSKIEHALLTKFPPQEEK